VSGFKINETADSSPDKAGFGMTKLREPKILSSRSVFCEGSAVAYCEELRKANSSPDKARFGMTVFGFSAYVFSDRKFER
jgi:hypothetical protein